MLTEEEIDNIGKALESNGISHSDIDEYFEHHGVKGMKWGIRRDPKTGVRPLARTLDKSLFGRAANANVKRSMARSSARRDLSDTQQARLERSRRVAAGKGSAADTLRVAGSQSLISLIRNNGLQGAAAKDVAKLEARRKSLKRGDKILRNMLVKRGPVLFTLG